MQGQPQHYTYQQQYQGYPIQNQYQNYPQQQMYIQPTPQIYSQQIQVQMKTCKNEKGSHMPCCNETKSITEFQTGKTICKACMKTYNKAYQLKKRQEKLELEERLRREEQEKLEIKVKDESIIKDLQEKVEMFASVNDGDEDILIKRFQDEIDEKDKAITEKDKQILQLKSLLENTNIEVTNLRRSLESVNNEKIKFEQEASKYRQKVLEMSHQMRTTTQQYNPYQSK